MSISEKKEAIQQRKKAIDKLNKLHRDMSDRQKKIIEDLENDIKAMIKECENLENSYDHNRSSLKNYYEQKIESIRNTFDINKVDFNDVFLRLKNEIEVLRKEKDQI